MKKVLLGIIVILGIVGALLYDSIIATIDFYQYQQTHAADFAKATITWKQIPFTSTGNSGTTADQALQFGSLHFPVPFPSTKTVGTDAAVALGGTQSLTITRSGAAAEFFRMYNFTDNERKAACAFLSQTSGRGACTTNYDLYRAFLELNQTDIHALAPTEDKLLYNRLLMLRAGALPSSLVSGFETSSLRGFLFTLDNRHYVAEVFDQLDQQYRLEFTELRQSDVAFVLSNTSIVR